MDTGTTYDTIVYAGFWRRFAAFLIDIVIVLVITNVIELALWLSGNISASKTTVSFFSYRFQAPFPIVTVPFHPLCLLVGWPYFAGLESSARRATIGKMTLSIYVTDYSGGELLSGGQRHAIGRSGSSLRCSPVRSAFSWPGSPNAGRRSMT